MKSVPTVESFAERPIVEWTRRSVFLCARKMPFTHCHRVVTGKSENLRQRAGARIDAAIVAGLAIRPFGDDAHTNRMCIPPGKQTRAGRRAHRSDMEIIV